MVVIETSSEQGHQSKCQENKKEKTEIFHREHSDLIWERKGHLRVRKTNISERIVSLKDDSGMRSQCSLSK